jgi:hypothetical protein
MCSPLNQVLQNLVWGHAYVQFVEALEVVWEVVDREEKHVSDYYQQPF